MIKENKTPSEVGVEDITYLKDIKRLRLLSYSSTTSIKNFCKKHRIPLLGSTRKYVLTIQLVRAQLEDRIRELKKVYGSNWLKVVQSEMSLYTKYKSISEEIKQKQVHSVITEGKPVNDLNPIQAKFLLDIQKLTEL